MTTYKCASCGRDVESIVVERKVRCHYCSGKVLKKIQSAPQTIKAI